MGEKSLAQLEKEQNAKIDKVVDLIEQIGKKTLSVVSDKVAEADSEKEKAILSGDSALPGDRKGPDVFTRRRSGDCLEGRILEMYQAKTLGDVLQKDPSRLPNWSMIPNETKAYVKNVKEMWDIGRFIAQRFHGAPLDTHINGTDNDAASSVKNLLETPYGKDVLAPWVKAFDSTGAATGGAWVPTATSASFIPEFELELRVANAFREMPMPTPTFKVPRQDSITVARIIGENATITDTNFTTSTIDFVATKLGEFYRLPEELNEDSAPAIFQIARGEVTESQVRARETITLSGDDSGTHMDNDVTAADDARKLAKGLRKLALDNTANGSIVTFSSAVTKAKLDEMRRAAGRLGINPRDLGYIFSPTTYLQALEIDEVTTVEKFGNQATILTGALAIYRGIPIFISEYVREDVAATGVNTLAGPNDKGLVHLANIRRFWVGVRRPIMVRVMRDLPDNDRWLLASYSRIDFKGHPQGPNEVSTVLGVDVTL